MFQFEPELEPAGSSSATTTKPLRFGKYRQMITDLLESLIIAALVCAFIYAFVATPNIVNGPSMFPTFKEGQLVLTTSRLAHWLADSDIGRSLGLDYMRGEVVVFHNNASDEDLIKRLIAVPGDIVKLEDGYVYINGEKLAEPYLEQDIFTQGGSYLQDGEELTIPAKHYFMMGDNRPQSRDSRDSRVGLINRDDILGKVMVRYWPLSDFAIIRPGEVTSS
jgi:signal peptidase I